MATYAISLVACFGWMGSGKAERYEIRIDTATSTISASDRVRGVQMWEDDFNLSGFAQHTFKW